MGKIKFIYCAQSAFLFAALFCGLLACTNRLEEPLKREFGSAFVPERSSSFHAAEAPQSPCRLLAALETEQASAIPGSTETFSLLRYFSLEANNAGPTMRLGSTVGESPFLMYLLSSEKLRSQIDIADNDFFDVAKLNLKLLPCALEDHSSWGYGCRLAWNQVMPARGCALEAAADQPVCAAIWQAVQNQQEFGRCAYVQTGPPNPDDSVCREAKQKLVLLTLLKQQNKLYVAKNKILEERIPGVFGSPGDGSKSLLGGILSRVPDSTRIGSGALSEILTKRLPLFPESRNWNDWSLDVRNAVGSLLVGWGPNAPPEEKVCSVVVAQRLFAQVLALNGFLRPDLKDGNLEALSPARDSLGANPVMGAYLRKDATGEFVHTLLVPLELESYNPQTSLILASSQTPKLFATNDGETSAESLPDRLARLEGLEFAFEATSPVAAWLSEVGGEYPLGDLERPGGSAILPAEAHALTFAHLALNFRNLAALNLKQLNAQGNLLRDGERPMGFVLLRAFGPDHFGEMHLSDLLRFARLLVRFDEVSQKLLQADPLVLRQRNGFYSDAVLERVRETAQNLRRLKLPLILLLKEMAEQRSAQRVDGKVCFGAVRLQWGNAVDSSVRRVPLRLCSESEMAEYQEVRQLVERSILGERN